MPMDPRTAPKRDLVTAYTAAFGGEGGRMILADLDAFVRGNMASQRDRLGRIDPFQVVAEAAARRVLERIQAMAVMGKNPEWLAIDRGLQLAGAETKLERSNG